MNQEQPKKNKRRSAVKLCLTVVFFYVFAVSMLYVFQRNLTFQPSAENPFLQPHPPFEAIVYKTPMGLNLRGFYKQAAGTKPTIVYFQGNAGNLADRLYKADAYLPKGYGMLLVGYRGYSGNPGQSTEQNFYEDARSAINAIAAKGVSYGNMVLYGESIGSGVATQMATEFPARALVLEAPFTSVVDIGSHRYPFVPVRFLMKDRFDNEGKIGLLKMPALIVHGTDDQTVPYSYGQKLYSHVTAPVREFVTVKGAGHGNLYQFGAGDAINAFLARL